MASSVDRTFERKLAGVVNSREQRLLVGGRRGLERESLRVTADARITRTPHPAAFGSALTNPHITTDYSEALLELVTPTFNDNAALMQYLTDLHQFVYHHLGDELLWATSMPCEIGSEDEIPIARYGSSFPGQVKYIYRHGLRIRYGGIMQAISGVHFNYSFPEAFWPLYAEVCRSHDAGQSFISARYFDLLRNYRRHGWLVSYLFGASPALCRSFLLGRHDLELQARDAATLVGPYATSLRMSDIGYRNRSQSAVAVSVNSLEEYIRDLRHAIHQPHPRFMALGVKVDDQYQQLSGNMLQIENEYYSYIRPKRTLEEGERTVHALARGGVEYVEVRALDNSAFDAIGVNPRKLHFLEAFLQLLLMKDSAPIDSNEEQEIEHNHLLTARRGREPGLKLERSGRSVSMADWAAELLDQLQGICELLDHADPQRPYSATLADQLAKLQDVQRTPSARLLAELEGRGESFEALALRVSQQHRDQFRAQRQRNQARWSEFTLEAELAQARQAAVEGARRGSLDAYIARYLAD
jgi:glutamate--cysteine ligase